MKFRRFYAVLRLLISAAVPLLMTLIIVRGIPPIVRALVPLAKLFAPAPS